MSGIFLPDCNYSDFSQKFVILRSAIAEYQRVTKDLQQILRKLSFLGRGAE